jgi:arsenate reductase
MSITIYHNPRCSKSRQTLSILEGKGMQIDVIEYLQSPPDVATLKSLIKKLGISPKDLVRKGEEEYKLAGLDKKNITDEEIIQAMVKYPKLIERPIVVNEHKAALGRPPENVLSILE